MQCTQILKFSQAGEHKSAVDLADKLIKNGCKCSDKVSQRIDFSRSQLKQADAYVLEAMKRKKEGKLIEAQTNLLKALEIYPKYYWARNLLKKVECSINAQITGLKEEAHNLESDGNLDGALSLIQDAIALSPGDNNLKLEATRLQEAMNILLQEEKKRKQFTLDQRRSIIRKGLVAAQEAEQKDDLESAAGHTIHILELSSAGEPLTPEIVEFARLLGLKLFSTGDFSKAQNLWKEALHLAPGNAKLQKYLAEVEESLDNLKKIQPTPPRLS
ncbi:MAG: hypothetical protein U9N63_07565 [Pseudomonadota bacterium]|nr:hypothetical protein [Pseudomonadota bacterium]